MFGRWEVIRAAIAVKNYGDIGSSKVLGFAFVTKLPWNISSQVKAGPSVTPNGWSPHVSDFLLRHRVDIKIFALEALAKQLNKPSMIAVVGNFPSYFWSWPCGERQRVCNGFPMIQSPFENWQRRSACLIIGRVQHRKFLQHVKVPGHYCKPNACREVACWLASVTQTYRTMTLWG